MKKTPGTRLAWTTVRDPGRTSLVLYQLVNDCGKILWSGMGKEDAIAKLSESFGRLLSADERIALEEELKRENGGWPLTGWTDGGNWNPK